MTPRSLPIAAACVAVLLLVCPAYGQGSPDGSIFSRFGIGDLKLYGSPQIVAMGGGATGLGGRRYTNSLNPATLANISLTGVSAGLSYESVDITDRFDNTSRLSSGSLRAVQFSFPLLENKVGIGASFLPYSRRRYRVEVSDVLDAGDDESVDYTVNFLGKGGLQKAALAAGIAVSPNVSVGVEGHMLFGLIEESQETAFETSLYQTSLLTNAIRLRGFSARLGVLVGIPGLRSDDDLLTVGAQFTLPTSLTAEQTLTSGPEQERDTLSVGADGDVDLPFSASIGAAYRASARWLFVADFRYEPWTEFTSTLPLPGYDPADPAGLNDRTRVSAGFQVIPAGNDLLASFPARVGYRLGFFYDPVYLSSNPDRKVNTIAVTGGLSLPTRVPGTRIDMNVEVGTRGTADTGLVRERFVRFGLNLNVGERWFLKTRIG